MLRVPIDEAGIPVGDIHVAYNKARRRMHVAARQESGNDMIRSHTEPGVPDFYEKAATIRPDCICVEGVRAPPEWGDVVTRFKVQDLGQRGGCFSVERLGVQCGV